MTTNPTPASTPTTLEVFQYLDDLRESGRTNMWGAAAYMTAELDMDSKSALDLLGKWMETFDGETSVEVRAALSEPGK